MESNLVPSPGVYIIPSLDLPSQYGRCFTLLQTILAHFLQVVSWFFFDLSALTSQRYPYNT